MTSFILDASVTMRWVLESNKKADQQYAWSVLESFTHYNAIVPQLWHLEVVSVLLTVEKNQDITPGMSEAFILQLENLPIDIDQMTAEQAFNRTFALARTYKISSYDASYLELAIRLGLPLATLDKAVKTAAHKADVLLYLDAEN